MSQSIIEIQEEIVDEFTLLADDREETLFYLMELGEKLPPLEESLKIDKFIVEGCQSKVWLVPEQHEDSISFGADSNSDITKGLVSLLVRIFNNQKAEDILDADLFFIEKIGMSRFVGTQRSNGFASMIRQIKIHALLANKSV